MEKEQLDGCMFQWKIKNISQYPFRVGEELKSPAFVARLLGNTKLSLRLCPLHLPTHKHRFCIFIKRELNSSEAKEVEINCRIAILDKNSLVLTEKMDLQYRFSTNGDKCFVFFMKLSDGETEYLFSDDTLTLQCTLWNQGELPVNLQKMYARTVLKVSRRPFKWRIPQFSTRITAGTDKFRDTLMQFDITLNIVPDLEGKITINSFDESIKRFSLKTSFLDSNGEIVYCDTQDYSIDNLKTGILTLPPTLLTDIVKLNKKRFLHNDILNLRCECIFITTDSLIEFLDCTAISPKLMKDCVENKCTPDVRSVINDFQAMYNEAILSDIDLRTSTKTFPAHKNVLSARSPVFRRMFSNDMKEKNTGHVDIIDLQDNTMHQMLLYMYTGKLEDLDFEKASMLYAAADKYEILYLKNRCSSFLKENVCPTNACEVLVLADLHNDDDLKIAIQDYILGNHKQVFCLQEWKLFMDSHLKLAADVMYRKINQE